MAYPPPRAGDRIASEHELVRELGVARMTVRRALDELTQEGLIVRRALEALGDPANLDPADSRTPAQARADAAEGRAGAEAVHARGSQRQYRSRRCTRPSESPPRAAARSAP
jgi:DNA-binding transcriptional MocR family regulator